MTHLWDIHIIDESMTYWIFLVYDEEKVTFLYSSTNRLRSFSNMFPIVIVPPLPNAKNVHVALRPFLV